MLRPTIVAMIVTIVGGGLALLAFPFRSSQTYDMADGRADRFPVRMSKPHSVVDMVTGDDSVLNSAKVSPTRVYPPDSPEAVVAAYADASTWQERLPFVKRTPDIEGRMARHYGHNRIHFDYARIVGPEKHSLAIGDTLDVHIIHEFKNAFGQNVSSTSTYYLEKTESSYVILWESSLGWIPIGWSAFKASRPSASTELQLRCALTHNYFGISTKASVKHTHFELEIRPDDKAHHAPLVAYMAKKSPAGERIFQTLSDGREHPMVLEVQFRDAVEEDCVWVRSLASDRAYVYDDGMRHKLTSPIEVAQAPTIVSSESVPFEVSDVAAQWVVDLDVLGGQVLVVPEVRFRVANASADPISSLSVKAVFVLKREGGSGEVLYEDTQVVVSANDRPLDAGFSKTVISRSGKGYRVTSGNATAIAAIISGSECEVEIYYDADHGFTTLQTIPVTKTLSQ
jgi:hypothetical protein